MRHFLCGLGIAVSLVTDGSVVDGAGPPANNWKLLSEAAGDYTLTYPASFKVVVPKVQVCSGQQCRATDELLLTGAEGSINFVAQRNINPGGIARTILV